MNGTPRQLPYAYGTKVDDCQTLQEVITKAGLDYDVRVRPLYYLENGRYIEVPDAKHTKGILKNDTEIFMGTTGVKYTAIQNGELFKITENIIDGNAIKYNYAGHFDDRKKVYISAKLEGLTRNNDDPIDMYLVIRTSHDGSGSTVAQLTPIRMFCNNQLPKIKKTAVYSFRVKHTKNYETTMLNKLALMTSAETIMSELVDFTKILKRTNLKKTTDLDLAKIVALSLGAIKTPMERIGDLKTPTRNKIAYAVNAIHNGVGQNAKDAGTAFWVVNGLTTFEQNHQKINKLDSYLNDTIFDNSGTQMADKVLSVLTQFEYV